MSRFMPLSPPLPLAVVLLSFVLGSAACSNGTDPPESRAKVAGTVIGVQSNTRLFFYDEDLNQLGPLSIAVRPDGTYGPLTLPEGRFFAAATASGFTTGAFQTVEIDSPEDSLTIDFDLDPITVPLTVGNRWTYEETAGSDRFEVTVEITERQAGDEALPVYTVRETRAPSGATGGDTQITTYYLAQDGSGIRKSADPLVDANDELLLRLPATLGISWTTTDSATGATLQKRIRALSCDSDGCRETNDFTIAQEPAGIFMSVSELHEIGDLLVVTVFSDIGIVDSFVASRTSGDVQSQRKLTSFQAGPAGAPAS